MNVLAYTELNFFSMAFLLFIYFNVSRHGGEGLYEQKLFQYMLWLNFVELVLDTLQWLCNGAPGAGMHTVCILIAAVYCALTPVPCFVWSLYADYQVYRNEAHVRKIARPFSLLLIFNCIIAALSTIFGLSFSIDGSNYYHRGAFFYVMASICFFYLFYSMVFVFLRRKTLNKKTFLPLMLFAVPPFVGGIIQAIWYGVSIVWSCTALSILNIFINLQNSQLYTDYLTGLYNRRQLDSHLKDWFKNGEMEEFGGILADLDCFKTINDVWGHDAGDMALVDAGEILRDSFRKEDFICRYGGDEFIIILKIRDVAIVKQAAERLKEKAIEFNKQNRKQYTISFSTGYDIYRRGSGLTYQQFFKNIDNLMYEDKRKNKIVSDGAKQ